MVDAFFLKSVARVSSATSSGVKRFRKSGKKQQQQQQQRPLAPSKRRHQQQKGDSDDNDEVEDDDGGGVGDIDLMDLSRNNDDEDEEEEDKETPAMKRLRLAKMYLSKVRSEVKTDITEVDAAKIDRDIIAHRIQNDILEAENKIFYKIADKYTDLDPSLLAIKSLTSKNKRVGKSLPTTSVSVAIIPPTGMDTETKPSIFLYSTSKDASISKFDFYTGKLLAYIPGGLKRTRKLKSIIGNKGEITQNWVGKARGAISVGGGKGAHTDEVLCSSVSFDGKFLATGSRDNLIHIWSTESDKIVGTFKQHRDAVSGLAFRKSSNQLYSASFDRSVKVWNVDELSYIETLFGHQDKISSVAALHKETCLTPGSRDRTVRLWKIVEESQLIFRSGGSGELDEAMDSVNSNNPQEKKKRADTGGSVDCVTMIDEETFLSGSDNGSISIWSVTKKKPVFTKLKCHGNGLKKKQLPADAETDDRQEMEADIYSQNGYCPWITSLACVPFSDMFASGSSDGFIKLWKISANKKAFSLLANIPMAGFINGLEFFKALSPSSSSSEETLHLAAAVGQEHRLGRWWRLDKKSDNVQNQVKVIQL